MASRTTTAPEHVYVVTEQWTHEDPGAWKDADRVSVAATFRSLADANRLAHDRAYHIKGLADKAGSTSIFYQRESDDTEWFRIWYGHTTLISVSKQAVKEEAIDVEDEDLEFVWNATLGLDSEEEDEEDQAGDDENEEREERKAEGSRGEKAG